MADCIGTGCKRDGLQADLNELKQTLKHIAAMPLTSAT